MNYFIKNIIAPSLFIFKRCDGAIFSANSTAKNKMVMPASNQTLVPQGGVQGPQCDPQCAPPT